MKIKEGEKLPASEFFYLDNNNVVQTVDTITLLKGHKAIIFGVPGAFTKVCSAKHLPSYVKNFEEAKKKGVTKIICLSVNDPNVMQAWGDQHGARGKIFMLGDPFCKFTKSIGAEIDRNEKGLGMRSSRYTMLIEDGVVTRIKSESDAGTCEVSAAENFLNEI
jgi:2-Cys peroxiredoxin 5|tara:strand:+ start:219 stop:707 length:489 start_codon:yes stop_codon:yes gene_type:complete